MYTVIQASRKFGIDERLLRIAIKAGRVKTQMISKHDLTSPKTGMPALVLALSNEEMERLQNDIEGDV